MEAKACPCIMFAPGQFDPPGDLPWSHLGPEVINSKQHKELARKIAQKGEYCQCLIRWQGLGGCVQVIKAG